MSVLNVTSIKELLVYLYELVEIYGPRILLRPSIVMSPDFFSPLILSAGYSRYLEDAINYLEKTGCWPEMKDRLCEILRAMKLVNDWTVLRKAFLKRVEECDGRRMVKFVLHLRDRPYPRRDRSVTQRSGGFVQISAWFDWTL